MSAAGLVLAQDGGGLTGWYVGFAIGAVVVVVVVAVVGTIIKLAHDISELARDASAALDQAHRNTLPLWDVSVTNQAARRILAAARTARSAVEG